MKKFYCLISKIILIPFLFAKSVFAQTPTADPNVIINPGALGFQIPTFSDLLTFLIRFAFVLAGLAALLFLLWGSFDWIASGGEKEKVSSARSKIIQALIGVIVIIATLTIIWSLENIVFKRTLCFGISCPITLPQLLRPVTP